MYGRYRCVVASAINFINVWQASNEQQNVLDLPPGIDAEDRARVVAFAESLGLAHETMDTSNGAMLRIAPAVWAATAETAAAAAAETAAQANTEATAQAQAQAAAPEATAPAPEATVPTRPPPPPPKLTEAQRERMAANKADALARRAAAEAAADAQASEAATSASSAPLPGLAATDQASGDPNLLTLTPNPDPNLTPSYTYNFLRLPVTVANVLGNPDRPQRRHQHK